MNQPVLRISRTQLIKNITAVQNRLAPSTLMLIMKDDAYGHGIDMVADVAQRQAGVSLFGGYDIATSLQIRSRVEPSSRVFAWATSDSDEVEQALRAGVDLGVGTLPYLHRVIAAASITGVTAKVHLKIDTGLRRNGVRSEDWPEFVAQAIAAQHAGSIEIAGVWSHLAEASDADDDLAAEEFRAAVEMLRRAGAHPTDLHLTASAASWWRPELRGSVSRVGAFCYGIRSADGPELEGIRPIAALTAPVIGVDGDRAVIGIGAFDGLPSTLSGIEIGTTAGNRQLQRIGVTTSELAAWPGATVGDDVWIFGPGHHGEHSATTLAESIDTVGEEIITRLTSRVRRVIGD
ncbi:hypothetical protein DC31_14155 [Microbacterium sp. CH12i]|nr:hypothetical protein DC31_14155 [Microbacterium sp. CH12i]